tara:strand:- start:36 stop:1775 length:1740 start_codon:yes stop_codon:yes gene_type:complete
MFAINYKKNENDTLFKNFNDENLTNIKLCQNYIPLYNSFFKLNPNNFNSINLNNKNIILELKKKNTEQIFDCIVKCNETNETKKTFIKFSPLLDPIKYLTGKYKETNIKLLPKLKDNTCHEKILDKNNSGYVDSFFSFLSSILLHNHKFINALDFYGSFLGIKNKFHYNIFDDLEYLYESNFFKNNNSVIYDINEGEIDFYKSMFDSKCNKKKLKIKDDNVELEFNNLNNDALDLVFDINNENTDCSLNLVFDVPLRKNMSLKSNNTSSTCSSRSSHTDESDLDSDMEAEFGSEDDDEYEEDDDEYEDEDDEYEDDDEDEYEDDDEEDEKIVCNIFDFPVQMICLEKLENTLDSLLESEEHIGNKQWESIFLQIIFTLITFQKCFNFTHNDLHTNNIMFNNTDKQYIYYRYNQKIYKVPTFGKIIKIIDFGRSIYTYKGNVICSDSFHPKGDAATQYNFGTYYNEKKKLVEPNYSFDLCRLGCSLYDYFVDDMEELEDPIVNLVSEWIHDDNNKNILYKKNGEERYPEFKLYKMIARSVHNHTPQKQLERPMFQSYIVKKKKLKKKTKIIDIDSFEVYV